MWQPRYAGVVVVVRTKWGSHICRERFDLESPILCEPLHPSALQTRWIWRHYVLPVGSYRGSKMPHTTASLLYISWTVEIESPNFTGTSMPTCPTFTPDITSPTTSGRKLQRKKQSKMPPQPALGRILVPQRLASPPIGGLLVIFISSVWFVRTLIQGLPLWFSCV